MTLHSTEHVTQRALYPESSAAGAPECSNFNFGRVYLPDIARLFQSVKEIILSSTTNVP